MGLKKKTWKAKDKHSKRNDFTNFGFNNLEIYIFY